ncbi:MAG: hypothetical protein COV99_03810 [Bacteroidetes bacterium CG12_big_fil_rev_8_21_14_0_65_60_17]|nr:MAG: hypothetical protein COV99_03810 [Bacteroidetes bacterium CG12_big_fil_rev_8_21_14_0_65_60_17]
MAAVTSHGFDVMITFADGGEYPERAVVTVGSFDGVHLGHRLLVERAGRVARERGVESVVLTFNPHPGEVLGRPGNVRLTSVRERITLLHAAGADRVAVMAFDRQAAALTPHEFVEEILVGQLRACAVIMGHDHRFGKERRGDIALMTRLGGQLGFDVFEVAALADARGAVSSSRIRAAIGAGRVEDAARMLGRAFSLRGTVVHGDGRGSTIGFPTANLDVDRSETVLPARGVYAVWAEAVGLLPAKAMLNIGIRPTFGGSEEHAEVHVLDTKVDLYGCEVRAEFVIRLRDESKFDGAEALVRQLNEDRVRCRAALR